MNNKIIIGLLSVLVVLQLVVSAKVAFGPEVVKLTGPQGPQGPAGLMGAATPADQITNWIGGAFSGDVSVGGQFTLTETNTSSVSGSISIPKAISITMANGTTTVCSVLNSSGVTRTLLAAGVVDKGMAASSTGVVAFQAGTSTYSGANGSSAVSYTKFVNTVLTRINGRDVLTPTSTFMATSTNAGYAPWGSGSYFNFISGTTTNQGNCEILYY